MKKETDTEDLELQWDHTPEQYELESTDMDNFEHLLRPRPIFNEENLQDQETLSSDDDVFMPNTPPERRSTKLTRRNAIRRKKLIPNIHDICSCRACRITKNFVYKKTYFSDL